MERTESRQNKKARKKRRNKGKYKDGRILSSMSKMPRSKAQEGSMARTERKRACNEKRKGGGQEGDVPGWNGPGGKADSPTHDQWIWGGCKPAEEK